MRNVRVLLLLLAASIGANVALIAWLLAAHHSSLPTRPQERADTTTASRDAASIDRRLPANMNAERECPERLADCERASWDLVSRALTLTPLLPTTHDDRDSGAALIGREAQAAALCTLAERSLREQWERDRSTILANLTRSLADAAEQERNVVHEATEMSEAAGLNATDRALLVSAYRTTRGARIAEIRAALDREPPDVATLPDLARSLFADEDALLDRVGGPAARESWRVRQVQARSLILALTSTLASRDWDAAIGW